MTQQTIQGKIARTISLILSTLSIYKVGNSLKNPVWDRLFPGKVSTNQ